MSYKKTLILSASLIASHFMMMNHAAQAQASDAVQEEADSEDTARMDVVVVNARKRDESLQDVPLAVTALNAQALENNHVSVITDIDKLLPNIDLADNPFAGQALGATIRGIGFSDLEKSFEPAVGFSIDGVFLANNTGAAIDGFDLEQVEVLRGPQGTLYGRNTVGGVINVTRSRPSGEAGFKIGTRITNHSGREFQGVFNAPQIGGFLSTKAYVFKKDLDTFATNIVTGQKDKQTDSLSAGVAFLIEPNDSFDALVSFDWFDDDSFGPPTYSLSVPSGPDGQGDLFCDIPSGIIASGAALPNGAGCASGSIDLAEESDFELFARGTPFVTIIDGWSLTSNINYAINDNLTFSSVTGYRQTDEQLLEENVGGAAVQSVEIPGVGFLLGVPQLELLVQNRVQEASQFSQEFRLSGQIGDRLDFVSGIYYLDAQYSLTGGTFENGAFGNTQVLGGVTAITGTAQQSTAIAAFVDGTYDITDRLSLSAGFRYSYEEKDFQNNFIFVAPAAPSPANNFMPPDPNPLTGQSVDLTEDFDSPTGRVILQYQVADDVMVYGGYSRGFRSGGFNGRAASPASIGPFDNETVDSFEIGARTEWFGNRLRINPTAFYALYDDKQEENLVAVPENGIGATETFVENASEVEIFGFELEVLARITPELTVQASLGLTDAEFTEFFVEDLTDPTGQTLIDVSDSRNLRAGPDTTFSIGATYQRNVWNDRLALTLDTRFSHQSSLITSNATDPLGLGRDQVDSINSADFSASVTTLRDRGPNLTLTAFINDAFDDDAGRVASSIVIENTFVFGTGAPTTVYGIEASIEF
ncbi:MAG: TonB-dependent receptor [Hyphomonadaceae bacterium]